MHATTANKNKNTRRVHIVVVKQNKKLIKRKNTKTISKKYS